MCFFFVFLIYKSRFEVCSRGRVRITGALGDVSVSFYNGFTILLLVLTSRRFSRIEFTMDTALVSAPDPAANLLHSMDSTGTISDQTFQRNPSMGIAGQSPQKSLPRQSTSKFKPRLFQTEIAGAQHPKPIAPKSSRLTVKILKFS